MDVNETTSLQSKQSKSEPKRAYFTFHDGKPHYLAMTDKLGISIKAFSNYPLVVYGPDNIPHNEEFNAVNSVSGAFINKVKACVKALEEYDELVWLDCDIIALNTIDKVWDSFKEIENFPLLPYHHNHNYKILPWGDWENVTSRTSKEKDFLPELKEYLGLSVDQVYEHYLQSCVFAFNKECIPFFEEVIEVMEANFNKGDNRGVEGNYNYEFSDEPVFNAIMWKYQYDKTLGNAFVNSIYYWMKNGPQWEGPLWEFLKVTNKEEYKTWFEQWNYGKTFKENNFDQLLCLHGNKNLEICDVIINKITQNG